MNDTNRERESRDETTMNKAKKIIWRAFAALSLIVIAILGYKVIMSIVAPDKMPTFFGYSGSIVLSGSMEPTLSAGDMVICKEQDSYAINDIIAYYDEQEGEFVLHRIVGTSADGLITQGDFNPDHDPLPVKLKNVQGKVVLAIPNMKTYRDILLGGTIVLLVEHSVRLLVDICKEKKKGGEEADEET